MESTFTSLEQIRQEFQVKDEDAETIRAILRKRLASIHPDRNGGTFAKIEDKELFNRLGDAIEFIDDKDKSSALVSASAVTELAQAVTELVKAQSFPNDNSLAELIIENKRSYRSRFKFPKIALSSVTVFLTAIWIFPRTIDDHPVLSEMLNTDSLLFSAIWISALMYTATFWIIVWRREEKQREFQDGLKTEMVQNGIFRNSYSHWTRALSH